MAEPTQQRTGFIEQPHRTVRVSLRVCLIALVLVVALPAILIAGWLAWQGIASDREVSLQRLQQTTDVLGRAIEHEISDVAVALTSLAALGRHADLDAVLVPLALPRNLQGLDGRIDLIRGRRDPSADIMSDNSRGLMLQSGVPASVVDEALRTGRTVQSNLFSLPDDPTPRLALVAGVSGVEAPGNPAGRPFVALRMSPLVLIRTLQRAPPGSALAAVVDGQGRVLARSRAAEKFIDTPVPDWARLDAMPENEGTFQAKVAERNADVMFAFRRLPGTPGWVLVVGQPIEQYLRAWHRPLASTLAGSLVALVLTFPFAAWLARQVLRPVKSLAEHAERVVAGAESVQAITLPSQIREFERLRLAITDADQSLQARLEAERRSAKALAESELRYRTLVQTGAVVLWRTDASGKMVAADGWSDLTGQDEHALIPGASHWHELVHPDDRAQVRLSTRLARARGNHIDVEFRIVAASGDERWVRSRGAPVHDGDGKIIEWVGVLEDIDERRKAEGRIAHLAHHDVLTGLPNRALLADRIGEAIQRSENGQFSVLFIDVDQFKNVNDSLGHPVGDAMLCEVSRRIGALIGPGDMLSRISGDEFVVFLANSGDPQVVEELARRMSESVSATMRLGEQNVNVSITLGIAIYPKDGTTVADLFMRADAAMYHGKRGGRSRHEFYAPWMNEHAERLLAIESGLRRAIHENELLLHYQPKVSIRTGKVVAMEALVRWAHPTRGMIPPNEFIPYAEESGLIDELGLWVLNEACRQNKIWIDSGPLSAPVAVNLSQRQLYRTGMAERVAEVLERTGLSPQYLEFELTETALATRPEEAVRVLRQLSHLGVAISIDDFGTGYSSLAYLRRLPLDKLKIDRAFIRELAANDSDATIVQAVISMAHSLHMEVIAEGVESAEQLDRLRIMGCDDYQGYYCSRPIDATQFADFVNRHALEAANRQAQSTSDSAFAI